MPTFGAGHHNWMVSWLVIGPWTDKVVLGCFGTVRNFRMVWTVRIKRCRLELLEDIDIFIIKEVSWRWRSDDDLDLEMKI